MLDGNETNSFTPTVLIAPIHLYLIGLRRDKWIESLHLSKSRSVFQPHCYTRRSRSEEELSFHLYLLHLVVLFFSFSRNFVRLVLNWTCYFIANFTRRGRMRVILLWTLMATVGATYWSDEDKDPLNENESIGEISNVYFNDFAHIFTDT